MIDWEYFINVSWFAIIALVFPFIWAIYSFFMTKRRLSIDKRTGFKFIVIALGIALILFTILTFLTGGIASFYFLEVGFFLDDRSLVWNVTRHLRIFIPYNPGMNLFVVSLLSGFVYSGLITFPPICKIEPLENLEKSTVSSNLQTKTTSSVSTVIAGSSAIASGVVCCSTSIVAVISPAFAAGLAPLSPFLISISLILLNITLLRYIFPRVPTTGQVFTLDQ